MSEFFVNRLNSLNYKEENLVVIHLTSSVIFASTLRVINWISSPLMGRFIASTALISSLSYGVKCLLSPQSFLGKIACTISILAIGILGASLMIPKLGITFSLTVIFSEVIYQLALQVLGYVLTPYFSHVSNKSLVYSKNMPQIFLYPHSYKKNVEVQKASDLKETFSPKMEKKSTIMRSTIMRSFSDVSYKNEEDLVETKTSSIEHFEKPFCKVISLPCDEKLQKQTKKRVSKKEIGLPQVSSLKKKLHEEFYIRTFLKDRVYYAWYPSLTPLKWSLLWYFLSGNFFSLVTHGELDIDEMRINTVSGRRGSLDVRPVKHNDGCLGVYKHRPYIRIPIVCSPGELKQMQLSIEKKEKFFATTCSHSSAKILDKYTKISVPFPVNISPMLTALYLISKRHFDKTFHDNSLIGPIKLKGKSWSQVILRPEILMEARAVSGALQCLGLTIGYVVNYIAQKSFQESY